MQEAQNYPDFFGLFTSLVAVIKRKRYPIIVLKFMLTLFHQIVASFYAMCIGFVKFSLLILHVISEARGEGLFQNIL